MSNNVIADRRSGDVVKDHLGAAEDINMKIPSEFLKCVVFLGREETDDDTNITRIVYRGTGFLIGVTSEKLPGVSYMYIVTAKHVSNRFTAGFYIRMNTRDGGYHDIK